MIVETLLTMTIEEVLQALTLTEGICNTISRLWAQYKQTR